MNTAKLFTNGKSQAVRLLREFKCSEAEVYIKRIGRNVLLIPKDNPWASVASSLDKFSDDLMADRQQPPVQSRRDL